jgi:hypothetical protein
VIDRLRELVMSESPSEVFAAAGRWLDAELAPDGFRWFPGPAMLERVAGPVRHQVTFDRESPEHTHGVVGVEATAQVTDDGLFDWRRANARRVTGVDDVVCRLLVGHVLTGSPRYRGGGRRSGVLLLWLDDRERELAHWVANFRAAVVPWFDEVLDPEHVSRGPVADAATWPAGVVEWLAYRRRRDLIPQFVERYAEGCPSSRPGLARGRELAAAGEPLGTEEDRFVALGWAVHTLTG